ncbi:MAG: hypothetical protein HFF01_03715 [Erysipelotrichaceae bacterium]|nr:hypothetical protein [Erysipelotrichaceae bacterium]
MDIAKMEEICSATCFKFINNEIVYPSNKKNMSYMIIYPTDGYYLKKEQYIPIFETIRKYQNNCYFLSTIEFEDSFTRTDNAIDLGYIHKTYYDFNYDDYNSLEILFENAFYDFDKRWGISIFQDFFALIYGENKIIKEIRLNYSNVNDLRRFEKFINSALITNRQFKNILSILLSNSK